MPTSPWLLEATISAFKVPLALGKLSLEKHCLWQKRYKCFARRRIRTLKNLVYSERIMNTSG